MSAEPTRLAVRSVAGRVASPYRGHAGDEPPDAPRAPSPPRPRAEVVAALSGLAGVTLEAGDDRVTLRRDAGEELVVGLPTAAEVALADLTFTGNEYIAMLAFDALVALFGPLSFALGDYTDLVDGTEPGAATTRYQAHMRVKAEALLEAMQGMQAVFGMLDGAMAKAKAQAIANRPAARRARHREIFVLLLLGLGMLAVWLYLAYGSKASVGATCKADDDCRSGQCLPRGVVHAMSIGGAVFPGPPPAGPRGPGVCTTSCSTDADCPSGMGCRDGVQWEGAIDLGTHTRMCAPAAWDGDD